MTTTLQHPELAARWCEQYGYTDYVEFDDGDREAVISRLGFTYAILADLSDMTYGDRWCYHTYASAKAALDVWVDCGGKEPLGWHRHPATGRRRPDGDPRKEFVHW